MEKAHFSVRLYQHFRLLGSTYTTWPFCPLLSVIIPLATPPPPPDNQTHSLGSHASALHNRRYYMYIYIRRKAFALYTLHSVAVCVPTHCYAVCWIMPTASGLPRPLPPPSPCMKWLLVSFKRNCRSGRIFSVTRQCLNGDSVCTRGLCFNHHSDETFHVLLSAAKRKNLLVSLTTE